MMRRIVCRFLSFIRLIMCCCLIILLFARSTGEAAGGIYPDFKELGSNKAKDVDYEVNTKVTDPGDDEIETKVTDSDDGKTESKAADSDDRETGTNATDSGAREIETSVADFGDYKIETRDTGSDIIVIAIHGGKIEQGTTELACALSSQNHYNYYSYTGAKRKGNLALHIASDKFEEPTALKMVSESKTTLSVHGCAGSKEFTYIGGRDTELANKIKEALTEYGFTVLDCPKHLAGVSPNNIVNKNMRGWGVQMEISRGLRTQFLSDGDKLKNYVYAISEAVNSNQ